MHSSATCGQIARPNLARAAFAEAVAVYEGPFLDGFYLMRTLVAAGDRTAALQHARVYEALVQQELGSAPSRYSSLNETVSEPS
jgi:hypothetical protein